MKRLIAGLLTAGCVLWAAPAHATTMTPGVWDHYRIEQLRASHGLRPVPTTHKMRLRALAWARHMARVGALAEDVQGQWVCYALGGTEYGSNVGEAVSVPAVQQALEVSPDHIRNLLGRWRWMGVAYARDTHGVVWIAQQFCR